MVCLTALLEYMTTLLVYINYFVRYAKLVQHDYCTSNQDVQNVMGIEPQLLSCTFVVTSTNDHKILNNLHKIFKLYIFYSLRCPRM